MNEKEKGILIIHSPTDIEKAKYFSTLANEGLVMELKLRLSFILID